MDSEISWFRVMKGLAYWKSNFKPPKEDYWYHIPMSNMSLEKLGETGGA